MQVLPGIGLIKLKLAPIDPCINELTSVLRRVDKKCQQNSPFHAPAVHRLLFMYSNRPRQACNMFNTTTRVKLLIYLVPDLSKHTSRNHKNEASKLTRLHQLAPFASITFGTPRSVFPTARCPASPRRPPRQAQHGTAFPQHVRGQLRPRKYTAAGKLRPDVHH